MDNIFREFTSGVITALVTPLTPDYGIKKDCLEDLIRLQLRNGVKGFFILGTYGEGIALHPSRRKEFVEALLDVTPSTVPIIVNVSSPSVELSLELAKHAADIGCSAVASLPPLYYKPDMDGLSSYFKYLSKADIPILIYNNPPKQGYDVNVQVFETIAQIVDSIKGIKDSSGRIERIHDLVNKLTNKYFIAAARDSLLLYSFLLGANAHICGICNVMPEIASKIHQYVSEGRVEEAVRLQHVITMLRSIIKGFTVESPAIVKELLRMRGIDVGLPILPLRRLSDGEVRMLKDAIRPIIENVITLFDPEYNWEL